MIWQLRHPHEFFWEPVRKWWHRNRQVRIERGHWKQWCLGAEGQADSHYKALQALRELLPEFGPMDGRVWRLIDDELEQKTYRVPRVPSVPYR